jgi:hypothetical protein
MSHNSVGDRTDILAVQTSLYVPPIHFSTYSSHGVPLPLTNECVYLSLHLHVISLQLIYHLPCTEYVSQLAFMSETKILNYTAYNNRSMTFTESLVKSHVYSVQSGTRDLAQRRRPILQLWPRDLVLSETSKQQCSMAISVQYFTALCTFGANLSNRTRISARTVPQERYFSSMEWIQQCFS